MAVSEFREGTAGHEARHAAASLLFGLPIVEASAIPDFAHRSAGHVLYADFTDVSELSDEEAHDLAVVAIVGDLGEPGWPPERRPSKTASTRDERQLAWLVERLGLSDAGWVALKGEGLALTARSDFRILEDAISDLLQAGTVLDERMLRAMHRTVETGRCPVQTVTVEASTKAIKGRGAFAAIADVYSPTRDKPRLKAGAFEQAIATWCATARAIPLHSFTGTMIGTVDPESLEEIAGCGVFFKGQLHVERAEAAAMWQKVNANRVAVECGPDFAGIIAPPTTPRTDAAVLRRRAQAHRGRDRVDTQHRRAC